MTAKMIYLHALTPVHSGTGQTAAIIDLPIAREKATGWPLIPASSLKGVLKDALTARDESNKADIERLFGKSDESGALCFGDQRLLCLPVRSYYGTFAYVSCPLALRRLRRDILAFGVAPPFGDPPAVADTDDALDVQVATGSALAVNNTVYLEDLDLSATAGATVTQIAGGLAGRLFPGSENERTAFVSRFALVSDAVFDFLCETATEISARVVLKDETKTAGNLWYEEAVPAEAVFCGPVLVESRFRDQAPDLLARLTPTLVQIGGKATVGRGLCRVMVA